ncbi:MAG: hypothetical protein PVI26_01350 [Chitinispirillia bacterium]
MQKKSYQYDDAIFNLENALQNKPRSRKVISNLEELYSIIGNVEKQLDMLHRLIDLYPHNLDLYKKIASIHEYNGNHRRSVKYYRHLYSHDTNREYYFNKLESIFTYLKDFNSLAILYESKLKNSPTDTNVINRLITLYSFINDLPKLERIYLKQIELLPRDHNIIWKLGEFYVLTNDIKKVRELFDTFLKSNESTQDDFLLVKKFYMWNRLYDLELEIIEKIAAKFPSHKNIYLDLGKRYSEEGDIHRAIESYKNHLVLNPDDTTSRMNLSQLYAWSDQGDKEIVELEKLYESNKNDTEFLKQLAKRYEWAGNSEKALTMYEKIYNKLTSNKKEKEESSLDFISELAKRYEWASQSRKALFMYEFLNIHRPSVDLDLKLFDLYSQLGLAKKRIEMLEKLSDIKNIKNRKYYLELLAITHTSSNNIKKAIKCYKILSDIDTADHKWNNKIAELYSWIDVMDTAVLYYEKSIKNGFFNEKSLTVVAEYHFWNLNYAKSLPFFNKLIYEFPGNKIAYYYLGEIHYQLKNKKHSKKYFNQAFTWLRRKIRSRREQEFYLLILSRTERYRELADELRNVSPDAKLFVEQFNSILYNLFNRNEFGIAFDLLDYRMTVRKPLTPELARIIDDQITLMQGKGRWDIANHLVTYLEHER